jgi:hypothetical protein
MLVLDMIEILPPLEEYKYDTWRILSVKCYVDNSVCLRSCIQNVNNTDACEIHGGPVNQVAYVTAWLNRNHYSMVVVGGRMR